MKLLITGGCGFLGSNLAKSALESGHELAIYDNLSRQGSSSNLEWLRTHGTFAFNQANVSDFNELDKFIGSFQPDALFHVAGQVAMTSSIENPRADFETNVLGGYNVLESVRRRSPQCVVVYSSTNKVYGDLEEVNYIEGETRYNAEGYEDGFDESLPLDFRSPYGCSKGATDQYMLDYARTYGLKTVVFRHSSIFGGRQFSTFDQGWVGWFTQVAIQKKNEPDVLPFTINGNGKQVRDVLFADDLIKCYFSATENIEKTRGQAFNIGGGMENSLSILELLRFLEQELDVSLTHEELPWRHSDQKVFVANTGKAFEAFGWSPQVNKERGLKQMINWMREIM